MTIEMPVWILIVRTSDKMIVFACPSEEIARARLFQHVAMNSHKIINEAQLLARPDRLDVTFPNNMSAEEYYFLVTDEEYQIEKTYIQQHVVEGPCKKPAVFELM